MAINWTNFIEMFFLGALGASSIEVFKLYELKGKLHYKKYQLLYKSLLFWCIVVLFISASGFLAWAMNENNPNATVWQVVISGMAMSSLAKKITEAFISQRKLHMGMEEKNISINDIFGK